MVNHTDPNNTSLNITAVGTRRSQWGEGPVWWQDHLYYVDIEGKALIRFDPATGTETVFLMSERIGFALPCADGRWIWGGDSGIHIVDLSTGVSLPVIDPESYLPNNRFNDAAISPDGRLFAGTIATDKTTGAASLYRLDPDHSYSLILPDLTNSNGIDWSNDGNTVYHIDTPTRKVMSYNYDADSGTFLNPRVLIDTDSLIDASPDGLTVDREGNLWIAFCHGGCVMCFDSMTGTLLKNIDLPCIETTSCCFGGPDLKTLYVTTGKAPNKEEPLAGHLFAITGLHTSGKKNLKSFCAAD